ncbi:MAG: FeoB-associated Cys-rich membrane protein [Treponema sp.]|nr:FeoB-associated Cys-rich membrane protein [Treponema sp.]
MGTFIVGIILVALVSAIIVSQVKNKKKGKSSCGGNCAHCAAACHGAHGGEVSPSLQPAGQSSATPSAGSDAARKACSTILEIDGMMCGMCESHINDAIRNNFSVKSVKSSHKTGICQIISDSPLDEEKLRSVISATGYRVKSLG